MILDCSIRQTFISIRASESYARTVHDPVDALFEWGRVEQGCVLCLKCRNLIKNSSVLQKTHKNGGKIISFPNRGWLWVVTFRCVGCSLFPSFCGKCTGQPIDLSNVVNQSLVQEGDIRIGGAKTTAVPESGICGHFVDLVRGEKTKFKLFGSQQ
jgi:hypothetical protein